jgi:hypothetical protein
MAWEPDYVTVGELADFVHVDDGVDDVEFARAITASSRAVDDCCGRQFGLVAAPELRTYTPVWDRKLCAWVCRIDDVATVAGSLLAGVPVTSALLYPRNAVVKGGVWTTLRVDTCDDVDVTMRWGWPAFPVPVTMATMLQSSRLVARRDSPFGVAGSPQTGSELRLLARLDPDVKTTLGSKYVRLRGPR